MYDCFIALSAVRVPSSGIDSSRPGETAVCLSRGECLTIVKGQGLV